jgi:hypothetical protein
VTRVIGLGGKLRHGKDTVADHLVDEHGWVKFGMSDALAEALYTLDPIINADPFYTRVRFLGIPLWRKLSGWTYVRYAKLADDVGYTEAKTDIEVRRLLQVLGTEVGRKQLSDGNLWTDIMKRKVRDAIESGAPGVAITGIRFPNELQMVRELGAESWWVERPSLEDGENSGHASENSVSAVDFDVVVLNDSTLTDLYDRVDALVT